MPLRGGRMVLDDPAAPFAERRLLRHCRQPPRADIRRQRGRRRVTAATTRRRSAAVVAGGGGGGQQRRQQRLVGVERRRRLLVGRRLAVDARRLTTVVRVRPASAQRALHLRLGLTHWRRCVLGHPDDARGPPTPARNPTARRTRRHWPRPYRRRHARQVRRRVIAESAACR